MALQCAGDKIPADVRFVRVSNLHVDESSLTGESVPVQKITAALPGQDLVPGDRRNTGFSGTYVSQGTATAVVTATGTLTENRMTVTRVYAGDRVYHVSTGATPLEGVFSLDGPVDVASHPALSTLLAAGSYCNNAHLSGEGGTGDPTEIALRQAGHKGGVRLEQIRRVEEIPFDSGTKYMAVLVDTDQGRQIWVKGAPEVVLGMCDQTLNARGQPVSLDSTRVTGQAKAFASEALRTLGFAMTSVPDDHTDLRHEDLTGLVFAGLQGMIDPPRAAARDAVATCKSAGIRIVMITGDHPETARAVAHLLGIDAARAVTGAELSGMQEAELRQLVESVSVFARVAPEHKKAIARALQANGQVVAMTGDGVNDAPALKAADIGIAMGRSGTELAREAADMVLQDDNFATIVAAVEEGRHAWNNVQKAILYTLPMTCFAQHRFRWPGGPIFWRVSSRVLSLLSC